MSAEAVAAALAVVFLLAAVIIAFLLGGGPRPAGTPALWVLTGQRPPFEFDPFVDPRDAARAVLLSSILCVRVIEPAGRIRITDIGSGA